MNGYDAFSLRNDNARYQIVFRGAAARLRPPDRIALVLDGKAVEMSDSGADAVGPYLGARVEAERIPALERLYRTVVHPRRHPEGKGPGK